MIGRRRLRQASGRPAIDSRRRQSRAGEHFLLSLDTQRARFLIQSFSHGVIFLVLRSTIASLSWSGFTAAAYAGRQTWHQFAFGFVDFAPCPRQGGLRVSRELKLPYRIPLYRLDGSTKRPEILLYFVRDTGWHSPQLFCPGVRTTSHTIYIGATGLGSSWAGAWGRNFLVGDGFGNGINLGSGKEQKTDTFCCIQGSWSQDRICGQAPRLADFREEDEAGGWRLGPSLLYIFGSSSACVQALDIVMQTNYLCHTTFGHTSCF